jgi:hypothetical protein
MEKINFQVYELYDENDTYGQFIVIGEAEGIDFNKEVELYKESDPDYNNLDCIGWLQEKFPNLKISSIEPFSIYF